MKSQNNNETIGDKIKQLRNKQGLTQDELARKANLPYTTLTKIESNVITKQADYSDSRKNSKRAWD
ncbi:MAG: helix-turn-helix transcriptional regulator [candidate division WOR-3 bacterium]